MAYYTRVLSKDEEVPAFDQLALFIRAEHPDYRLTVEEGSEEEWESLLLAGTDEVEVALIERLPVFDGSQGQDDISDLIEDLYEVKPESGVEWLKTYLEEVKTIYALQHLQGAETEDGGNVLNGLRSKLGSAETPFCRPMGKGLPMKMDSI